MGVQRGIMHRWMWAVLFACISLAHSEDIRNLAHDVRFENETLRSVLKSISEKYDVDIIFADAIVRDIIVNCSLEGATIDEVLREVLGKTQLEFRQKDGRQVVISKIPAALSIQLHGEVLDFASGKSLESANVQILNTCRGAVSDAGGIFIFDDLPMDDYTLQVSYIGYRDQVVHVAANRQPGKLRIELIAEPIPVEAVRTTPEPSKIQVAATRPSTLSLPLAALEEMPVSREADIVRGLQSFPGISNSRDGSSMLAIRGSNPSHTRLYLDDIPLFRYGRAYGSLAAFDSDLIGNIDIYKGNFAAEYGSAMAGIIDMKTRTADFDGFQALATVDPFSFKGQVQVPIHGKLSILLSGRKSYSRYLVSELDDHFNVPSAYDVGTGFVFPSETTVRLGTGDRELEFYDLFGKITWLASESHLFEMSALRTSDLFGDGGASVEASNPVAVNSFGNRLLTAGGGNAYEWFNEGYSARWHWQKPTFGVRFFGVISDYQTEDTFSSRYSLPLDTLNNRISNSVTAKYDYAMANLESDWQVSANMNFLVGVEALQMMVKNRLRGRDVTNTGRGANAITREIYFSQSLLTGDFFRSERVRNNGIVLNDTISSLETGLSDGINTNRQTVYMTSEWEPTETILLTAGVRGTRFDTNASGSAKFFVEPRLSLAYQASRYLALKAGWGHYRQFINRIDGVLWDAGISAYDAWVVTGVNGNKAGLSEHLVLGTQLKNQHWLLDLEVYQKQMSGLTDYHYSVGENTGAGLGFTVLGNSDTHVAGEGEVLGLDVQLQKTTGNLRGWVGYSYNRARIKTNGEDLVARYEIPHHLHVSATYHLNKWRGFLQWFSVSGAPYNDGILSTDVNTPLFQQNPYGQLFYAAPYNSRLPVNQRLDIGVERLLAFRPFSAAIGLTVQNLMNRQNVLYHETRLIEPTLPPGVSLASGPTTVRSSDIISPGLQILFYIQMGLHEQRKAN